MGTEILFALLWFFGGGFVTGFVGYFVGVFAVASERVWPFLVYWPLAIAWQIFVLYKAITHIITAVGMAIG